MILWQITAFFLPNSFLVRKNISGENVLITGSGSGIGRLLALRFAKIGARLVLWDINEKSNAETKKKIEEIGAEVFAYTVDLNKKEEIYRTAEEVKQVVGNINILVNNAGIVCGENILKISDEEIEKTMNVNILSHFYITKAFLESMIRANHGHIIEISSMAGKYGMPSLTDYCASKHAVVGFASSLAAELRSMQVDGVHVTTICPFFIDTGMFAGVKTFAPLILPILSPQYVVDEIMEAIVTSKEIVHLPKICSVLLALQRQIMHTILFSSFY
ncbi:unnamed protein product [Thelazia callipaeda]|uniref:Estradiol 17-beta-dehydrogenase 11 n=1 Tax=Thelazia callipaeda TaxID=103827 RepID=A0A0N5CU84_THECL|nr:unnamed protein product [Thelazia callipaeda]